MCAVEVLHSPRPQVVLYEDGGVNHRFPLPSQDDDALPQGDERRQLGHHRSSGHYHNSFLLAFYIQGTGSQKYPWKGCVGIKSSSFE